MFGIDNLETDKCVSPCQMRRIVSFVDPGYDAMSYDNDIAIAQLDFPVTFSREVSRYSSLVMNSLVTRTQFT